MCGETNCQHVKFDPNTKKTLSNEDQAKLWSKIKEATTALRDRVEFLKELGRTAHQMDTDPEVIKLEAIVSGLWTQFRKL